MAKKNLLGTMPEQSPDWTFAGDEDPGGRFWDEVCAHYEAGEKKLALMREYGVPGKRLDKELKKRGIISRGQAFSPNQRISIAFRRCCVCKELKFLDDFRPNKGSRLGRSYACKTCPSENNYARRQKTKRAALYGITFAELEAMEQKQNGLRAICGEDGSRGKGGKLQIDHCHKTDKVRELLCSSCNRILGIAKDNTGILADCVLYLRRHSGV